MINLYKLKREWAEFKSWAFKSTTLVFNTLMAMFAIFSETFHALQWAIDPRIFAALFIAVPMINMFLRMKTEKKHVKKMERMASDNEAGL
jgi:hypothetical protein